MTPEAVVLMGLQGSGKSHWVRHHLFDSHVRINLDTLRTDHREQVLLHACLAVGQSFVIDRTSPLRARRARYHALAHAAGFRTRLVWFDVPVARALERNAQRTGRARVPDVAIRGTAAKLQPPDPTVGWDSIEVARLSDTNTWTLTEWSLA